MFEVKYFHYIRINEQNEIIHAFSNAFEQPLETDILLCETEERHCRLQIFSDKYIGKYKVPKRTSTSSLMIYDQAGNINKCSLVNLNSSYTDGITMHISDFTKNGFFIYADTTSIYQRGIIFHYTINADF